MIKKVSWCETCECECEYHSYWDHTQCPKCDRRLDDNDNKCLNTPKDAKEE